MEAGERVRITTKNGLEYVGTLLPGKGLVIKLDDGYNVGIAERNVKTKEPLGVASKEADNKTSVEKNKELPLVMILHTGGTIASKVDYSTGGTSNLFDPEEILSMYPELQKVARVEARFVANMSSDDMRFAHYNILANAVKDSLQERPTGIIITQGTDTLHYTSAALHYALRNIHVPVVVLGSQRSSDRASSDAASNLMGAVRFITSLRRPGVFVAMHEGSGDETIAIYRGINCRKNHSSRRDAFRPVNIPQVARVTKERAEMLCEPPKNNGVFSVEEFHTDIKVGLCYVHPNMSLEELKVYDNFDGLVIIGTGLGHAPINVTDEHTKVHEENYSIISSLTKKMPVVMATQCINGRVNMQVYSAGRKLIDAGVRGQDMALSPETLFTKLAWLVSNNKSADELTTDYGDLVDRVEEQAY